MVRKQNADYFTQKPLKPRKRLALGPDFVLETLEELYGLKSNLVELKRVQVPSGKWLELFLAPEGDYIVHSEFAEFSCLCPKTSQPDFAIFQLIYIPGQWCVELKSLKYYLNSFRNEGHFHEAVTNLIHDDLKAVLVPKKICIINSFNTRGGISTEVSVGSLE